MKHSSVVAAIGLLMCITLMASGCAKKIVHSGPESMVNTSAGKDHDDQITPDDQASAQTVRYDKSTDEFSDADALGDFDDFDEFDEQMGEKPVEVADPLYYWNKGMYHFNDKMYFWVLKPAARGYGWAVPEPIRIGVDNFFTNLRFPIRLVGCLLQAKGKEALGECGKFGLNTTVGVLGFWNPANKYPSLNPSKEDMGQTFGKWGIGNGFFIIWPFLGPSTLRDSVGKVGDFFLDPVSYVDPPLSNSSIYPTLIKGYDVFNGVSLHIGDYETLKEAAIDPYIAIRDAYVQHRQKLVEE